MLSVTLRFTDHLKRDSVNHYSILKQFHSLHLEGAYIALWLLNTIHLLAKEYSLFASILEFAFFRQISPYISCLEAFNKKLLWLTLCS